MKSSQSLFFVAVILAGASGLLFADGRPWEIENDIPEEVLDLDLSEKEVDLLKIEPTEYIRTPFTVETGDSRIEFGARILMPEIFWGKNLNLLNSCNRIPGGKPIDETFYVRHTLDLLFDYEYGRKKYGREIVKLKATIRDRGIWGDPEAVAATTESDVKALEVVFGAHKHFLPRYIFWIRELWGQFSIADLLSIPLENNHFFTIGAFPFKLGRGIALGDAFAVTPDLILGFSAEAAVDQYAFGAKVHGDFIEDLFRYEIYWGLLNNKADTFSNTAAKIRGQEYGHKFCQARGFGIVNFIFANKYLFTPSYEGFKAFIEPYWLYNHDPEQRIEFLGDATSRLATIGIAGEFEVGKWEFGFDTAFNVGNQQVKGIDRNTVSFLVNNSYATVINTQVSLVLNPGTEQQTSQPLPFNIVVQTPQGTSVNAQNVVNTSIQSQCQDGKVILDNVTLTNLLITGVDTPVPAQLKNSPVRFRDPYTNKYSGSMFVWDASYRIKGPDLKASFGIGYASGDANPNKDLEFPFDSAVDGDYQGFISLQEIYPGTRIKSVLLLSGIGRIPRLLDLPSEQVNDRFASTVSRFTNLLFFGASMRYNPKQSPRQWDVNPNVLAFWQEFASRIFDRNPPRLASTYLGTEINTIFDFILLRDLKLWGKVAVFFPGGAYQDLKGRPINREQQRFLDSLDETGIITGDFVPLLGDDITWGFNFGFEYIF